MAAIELAPGAARNQLVVTMAELMRERLEAHPERLGTFERLGGRVAIVAEDTHSSLTMRFGDRRAVLFDGIVGIPDLTLRAPAAVIADLGRLETGRFGFPDPTAAGTRRLTGALRTGRLQIHGLPGGIPLLARLGRLMSVN